VIAVEWRTVLAMVLLIGMLVPPVSAGGYDNFTWNASDNIDIWNGTYTRYWLNLTGGFPWYGIMYAIVAPFMDIMGAYFFAVMWFLYLTITWFRTGNVTMPLVVGIISGTMFGALMPPEVQTIGYVILGICGATILVRLYMRDRV